ncbi:hypothetical protein V8F20_009870 [Naviculisporaceae sp. PSN 640]
MALLAGIGSDKCPEEEMASNTGPSKTFRTNLRDANPLWLQRRRQNYAECPIYKLNEDLLYTIVRHFIPDPATRHALWFTSSRFMRLISTLPKPVSGLPPLPPLKKRPSQYPELEIKEWAKQRVQGASGGALVWAGPSALFDAIPEEEEHEAQISYGKAAGEDYRMWQCRQRRQEHQAGLQKLLHPATMGPQEHEDCARCKDRKQHPPESLRSDERNHSRIVWCKELGKAHILPCSGRPPAGCGCLRSERENRRVHGVLRFWFRYSSVWWKENITLDYYQKDKPAACLTWHGRHRARPHYMVSGPPDVPVGEGRLLLPIAFCAKKTARVNICRHSSLSLPEVTEECIKDAESGEKRSEVDMFDFLKTKLRVGCGCPTADGGSGRRIVAAQLVLSSLPPRLRIGSRTRAFDLNSWSREDGGITLDRIRAWTLQESNEEMMRGIMCPHVRLSDGRLLLPFEQNQCSCFDHYGTSDWGEKVLIGPVAEGHFSTEAHDHHEKDLDGEWIEARGGPCCRCRSNAAPHRVEGEFMPLGNNNPAPTGTDAPNSLREHQFKFQYPSTGHNYTCQICQMLYSWTRDPQGRVYLQTSVTIDLTAEVSPSSEERIPILPQATRWYCMTDHDEGMSWIKHSEPESWVSGLQTDEVPPDNDAQSTKTTRVQYLYYPHQCRRACFRMNPFWAS